MSMTLTNTIVTMDYGDYVAFHQNNKTVQVGAIKIAIAYIQQLVPHYKHANNTNLTRQVLESLLTHSTICNVVT